MERAVALRRGEGYLGRTDLGSCGQDDVSFARVLARRADIVAARGGLSQFELLTPTRGVLDHHHRVGAVGNDAAGEDLDGFAFSHAPLRRAPCRRLVDYTEDASGLGVLASQRVPVNRRVIERWRVGGGREIPRERKPQSLPQRRFLYGESGRALEH